MANSLTPFRLRIARLIAGPHAAALGSVTVRVDDSPGWARYGTLLDRDWSELYQNQTDALAAWRTNPLARRIVSLSTDYVVGAGITLDSNYEPLARFIRKFWSANQMDLRLPEMCDELTRVGELFPVLSFDPAGMSLIRFKPASTIDRLEWQPGDYESETKYHEITDAIEGRWWYAPGNSLPPDATQVMLHHAVNRPIGCTRGEGDLAPILVWLKRYSGWLEDRVRLNWAARSFLYDVTVPANKVDAKAQQYARPPEPGSVIVHDDSEKWQLHTPNLQARDASPDGRAIRYMVGAGAGVPLHMLGEGENTNLATATAMQNPTFRQYARRQRYFCFLLRDLVVVAYEHWRTLHRRYRAATREMITATTPEISKDDNAALATAGREIVQMLATLRDELRTANIEPTDELNRRTVELAFRFAGEILTTDEINAILGTPFVDAPTPDPEEDAHAR